MARTKISVAPREVAATDPAGTVEAPKASLPTKFTYTDLLGAYEQIGKERPWKVEGAFEGNVLAVWASPEKGGKTWSAIDLCVSMVLGQAWLGAFPTNGNGGPPLYLDGEIGDYEFARRGSRLARGRGHDPRDVLPKIRHLNSRGIYLSRECEHCTTLMMDVRAIRPSVIIVDPWRNHLLGDENSARDTLDAMSLAASLRDHAEAPVLILHHLNRAGAISGSRALRTRADLILEGTDEREPHYSAVGRTIRSGDKIGKPFRIAVEHTNDDDDRIAKTTVRALFSGEAKSGLSGTASRLLEALRAAGTPCSGNELAKATGVKNGTARSRALTELREAGVVTSASGKWELTTSEYFQAIGGAR